MTARPQVLLRSSFCNLQFAFCILQSAACLSAAADVTTGPDPTVLAAEANRIETIARISRPTLAIFGADGQGGGSGVVISTDGYALTNFHVTAPTGPAMKCGLSDGRLVHGGAVGPGPG